MSECVRLCVSMSLDGIAPLCLLSTGREVEEGERGRERWGKKQTERIHYLCADMCHRPQLLLLLCCQRLRERAMETEISRQKEKETVEWGEI